MSPCGNKIIEHLKKSPNLLYVVCSVKIFVDPLDNWNQQSTHCNGSQHCSRHSLAAVQLHSDLRTKLGNTTIVVEKTEYIHICRASLGECLVLPVLLMTGVAQFIKKRRIRIRTVV